MYRLRPLLASDLPRLTEINPTFTSTSVLRVERTGLPPWQGWTLREEALATPYDKGDAYDFDPNERRHIQARLARGETCLLLVAEHPYTGRLVGILDVEEERWRSSGWIFNLMLDISVRRQGLGRRLVAEAIAWGRKRKLRALLLETQSNNVPACRFYMRMGFRLVGLHETYYTNHDLERDQFALFWAYAL
jgi:streptothricin acetyltransferase